MANEKRLIDANSLYQRLNERANDYALLDECTEQAIRDDMEIVQEQPTVDAVEVVRCKDCAKDGLFPFPMCYIESHELIFINHDPEFFCGGGERKEGADND